MLSFWINSEYANFWNIHKNVCLRFLNINLPIFNSERFNIVLVRFLVFTFSQQKFNILMATRVADRPLAQFAGIYALCRKS